MGAPRAGIDVIAVIAVMMTLMATSGIAAGQVRVAATTSVETGTKIPNTDATPRGSERTPPPPPEPGAAAQRSQAWSCLIGGTLAAAGAWAYAEFVVMATVTGATAPVLVPVLAAAFVTGCSVGTIALPGLGSIATGSR
jgi:hypothetical protein